MREIEREPLPFNTLNYILWVDKNFDESSSIWNILTIRNSTVKRSNFFQRMADRAQRPPEPSEGKCVFDNQYGEKLTWQIK